MRFNEGIFCDSHGNTLIKTYHSAVDTGDRGLREHHHTECELSIVISGSGTYYVGERKYSFSEGNMFLFGSNEAHCITRIDTPLNLLNIQFEPRLLWESAENIDLLRLFSSRNEKFRHMLPHTDEVLKAHVLKIEDELRSRRTAYAVALKSELFSALVHILRTYDYTLDETIPHSTAALAEKLGDAMLYIEKNLDKRLTLGEIAAVACMAPTYFSAVFKKFNGISPWDYIMIKRVERAVTMLRTTDMTKLEIAERCGFSSASNFYKIFTKITGRTPSDYSRNRY